jgi:phenylpropionate dioxygenase-like ring-hydroxylating dioxygenase large terminal subunit
MLRSTCTGPKATMGHGAPGKEFALVGSLEELKLKGRLVVRGGHRPILVIYDRGRVFALDNRRPHMGFPLERGSVEDGILTCHWHHARGRTTCRSARSSCAMATSG